MKTEHKERIKSLRQRLFKLKVAIQSERDSVFRKELQLTHDVLSKDLARLEST